MGGPRTRAGLLARVRVREHAAAAGLLLVAVAAVGVVADDGEAPGRAPAVIAVGPGGAGGAWAPPAAGAALDDGAAPGDGAGRDGGGAAAGDGPAPWRPGLVVHARRRAGDGGAGGRGGGADAGGAPPGGAGAGDDRGGARRAARGGGADPAAGSGHAALGEAAVVTSAGAGEDPPAEGTGLTADVFRVDAPLAALPRLGGAAPTLTRLDPAVDFPDDAAFGLPFEPDGFVIRWTGYLRVERPGRHTFRVGSDDGARLEVDNLVVAGADGLHGYLEAEGALELGVGLHLLRLTYFEAGGDAACRLLWAPPGAAAAAPIPRRALFPLDTARLEDLPIVHEARPGRAGVGEGVEVLGRGFSAVPEANEVRFGDARAFVLAADPERLLVAVPPGTDGGPLVVSVGGVPSPGVDFEVAGAFGLHARFVDVDAPPDRLAPLAGPPTFEALTDLDLGDEAVFGLPFAPDGFRSEWRGSLWVHRGGWHRFVLTCDDGGRLSLDGQVVVDHDGLHGATGRLGEAFLAEGPHEVLVEHFEAGGRASLRLEVETPGGAPRRVVPRGWLAPPPAVARQRPPVVTALDPPAVVPGQQVVVRGEALAGPGLVTRVTLGGVALPVVAPGWATLALTVPPGVDSGDLVVRVGPLASAPARLEVTGFGWATTIVRADGPLGALPPSLEALPGPRLERTDAALDFADDAAFGLPFPPDRFVVRWRGRYEVAAAGAHRFVLGADDGARLTVGGARLLEDDGLHPYVEREVEVWLPAGPVTIEVEYFENDGDAACRLLVAPPGGGAAEVVPRLAVRPAP